MGTMNSENIVNEPENRKHVPPGYIKDGFTRYIMDVCYKGTAYHGFQIQANANTVQAEVEKALERFMRKKIEIYSAGRTDTGVHGLQMPVQFDFEGPLPEKFLYAVNGMLPRDVAVNEIREAARPDFNVRFHATARSYVYRIVRKKMPFEIDFAWYYRKELDIPLMQRGAEIIKEYDSFESFCKAGGTNTTFFCKITDSRIEDEGDILAYYVSANRFLRGMVRAIIGTLLEMGKGNLDEAGLRKLMDAKNRNSAYSSLPPEGLTLTNVYYDEGEFRGKEQGVRHKA